MPAATRNSKSRKAPTARVLSSKTVFKGRVFTVTRDEVVEPGGVRAVRDVVRHPGSVVVLAVDSAPEPRVLLGRQYRHSAGQMLWELPAGSIDHGETALQAGKRELIEETGYRARRWQRALFFYPSPGFLEETMTIFLAQGLERGLAQPEDDERIATRFFSLSSALRMVNNGAIHDGKTIAGILWLALRYSSQRRTSSGVR